MRVIGVIPARFGSTRLPGKPLLDILGKPMIWWVWRQAKKAKSLDNVIVATDDERILKVVSDFGGEAMMTLKSQISGTDRVAEVASKISGDIFINIQGDEPLMDPATVDSVSRVLVNEKKIQMATAKVELEEKDDILNSSVVKVVVDKDDFSLYFSRSPIPYQREQVRKYWKHIGIYGYRRNFLLKIMQLPLTPLAKAESLEQLKVLEHGFKIKVVTVKSDSIGVDTEEDLEKVRKMLTKNEDS